MQKKINNSKCQNFYEIPNLFNLMNGKIPQETEQKDSKFQMLFWIFQFWIFPRSQNKSPNVKKTIPYILCTFLYMYYSGFITF